MSLNANILSLKEGKVLQNPERNLVRSLELIINSIFISFSIGREETFETLLNPYGSFKRFAQIFAYCISMLSVIMMQMLVLILAYFH